MCSPYTFMAPALEKLAFGAREARYLRNKFMAQAGSAPGLSYGAAPVVMQKSTAPPAVVKLLGLGAPIPNMAQTQQAQKALLAGRIQGGLAVSTAAAGASRPLIAPLNRAVGRLVGKHAPATPRGTVAVPVRPEAREGRAVRALLGPAQEPGLKGAVKEKVLRKLIPGREAQQAATKRMRLGDHKAIEGIVGGHELNEMKALKQLARKGEAPRTRALGYGHFSPDVLLQESNQVATLPRKLTAAGDFMRATRAGKEDKMLKAVDPRLQYGRTRLSRHARKRVLQELSAQDAAALG